MTLWDKLPPWTREVGEGLLRVGLSLALGPGREIHRVLGTWGSAAAALQQLTPGEVGGKFRQDTWVKQVQVELHTCEELGVRALYPEDPHWPPGLSHLSSSPAFLLVRGLFPLPSAPRLAIVGSRRASEYGRRQAAACAATWVKLGGVVVSGGATGIDAAGHVACLDAGGRTLAVLGSGLRSPYPSIHKSLFERIVGNGALISEYPSTFPLAAYRFPERNRLLAALSDVVLVVQCREGSGALHTARYARQLGRPLLAIPGPVDDQACAGSNLLLCQGARLLAAPNQLVDFTTAAQNSAEAATGLGVGSKKATDAAGIDLSLLDPSAQRVLIALAKDVSHIDDLCATLNVSPSFLSAALLEWELLGWVAKEVGNRYRLLVNLAR